MDTSGVEPADFGDLPHARPLTQVGLAQTGSGRADAAQRDAARARSGPGTLESDRDGPGTLAAWVLLAALAVGLARQGGYFTDAQWSIGLLVGGALLVSLVDRPPSRSDLRFLSVPVLFAMAGWVLLDGSLHDTSLGAWRPTLLLLLVAAVLTACRRLSDTGIDVVLFGLTALTVAVAATGWAGVAYRIHTWALADEGLWRASSTLTYPNATAAALVPVALLVLARLSERPGSVPLRLSTTALLAGTGATLSRAGVLALVVGLATLSVLLGLRTIAGAVATPALGALVILAGLLPSIPVAATAAPVLATVALLAGLAVGAGLPRLPHRRIGIAAVATLAAAAGAAHGGVTHAVHLLADTRASVSSPDRTGGLHAALGLFGDHPLTGAGPGLAELRFTRPDGVTGTLRYAHNEYAQVAAELGLVGLLLLAALAGSLALLFWCTRLALPRAMWAGVLAGVLAFAVHSGLDFVWHIPAIPLTVATLLGLVLRSASPHPPPVPDQQAPEARRTACRSTRDRHSCPRLSSGALSRPAETRTTRRPCRSHADHRGSPSPSPAGADPPTLDQRRHPSSLLTSSLVCRLTSIPSGSSTPITHPRCASRGVPWVTPSASSRPAHRSSSSRVPTSRLNTPKPRSAAARSGSDRR